MKKSIVAYTMAGVLGLVLGSTAWSCGTCSTTRVVHQATVVDGTKTVVTYKPVYHKVAVKRIVLTPTPVTYTEPARPSCGCGGGWFGLGGGNMLW